MNTKDLHPGLGSGALREALLLLPRKEYEVSGDGYVKLSDVLAALSLSSPTEPRTVSEELTAANQRIDILEAQLARRAQAPSEIREAHWQEFLEARGVETPCKKCGGIGTAVYGSTATWRGGFGGAAMTNGICDRCWGSGDENKHWTDLQALAPSCQGAGRASCICKDEPYASREGWNKDCPVHGTGGTKS